MPVKNTSYTVYNLSIILILILRTPLTQSSSTQTIYSLLCRYLFEECYFGAIMGVQKYRKLNACKKYLLYSIWFEHYSYSYPQDTFDSIFNLDVYQRYVDHGDRRLSHKAFQGAMMISLYRDEPRFHQPFQLLTILMDIDSLLTKWRCKYIVILIDLTIHACGT